MLYNVLYIITILLIINIPMLRNKDKFRLNLLFDGVINKILLGVLLCILLFDNFMLGLLFMLLLLIINLEIKNTSKNIEGFSDYFKK